MLHSLDCFISPWKENYFDYTNTISLLSLYVNVNDFNDKNTPSCVFVRKKCHIVGSKVYIDRTNLLSFTSNSKL